MIDHSLEISGMKKHELLVRATIWMNLKGVISSEKKQLVSNSHTLCSSIYSIFLRMTYEMENTGKLVISWNRNVGGWIFKRNPKEILML